MSEIDINTLAEFRALKLWPYRRQVTECMKCGHKRYRLPGWLIRLLELPHASFRVTYCQGGLEAQKTINVPTLFGSVQQEAHAVCAGQSAEHLHIGCTHCGFAWLQETKSSQ